VDIHGLSVPSKINLLLETGFHARREDRINDYFAVSTCFLSNRYCHSCGVTGNGIRCIHHPAVMIRKFPLKVIITDIKDYLLSTKFTELGVRPIVVRPVLAEHHNTGLLASKAIDVGFDEVLG
jgi:hypothetical protein